MTRQEKIAMFMKFLEDNKCLDEWAAGIADYHRNGNSDINNTLFALFGSGSWIDRSFVWSDTDDNVNWSRLDSEWRKLLRN